MGGVGSGQASFNVLACYDRQAAAIFSLVQLIDAPNSDSRGKQ